MDAPSANPPYERTRKEAADTGTKRFTDPLAWVKVVYLGNRVTPAFWKVNQYQDYLAAMFTDRLLLKPGGIPKPRIGLEAA
eukprot:7571519-Pyramimonas_sp.AAC.1